MKRLVWFQPATIVMLFVIIFAFEFEGQVSSLGVLIILQLMNVQLLLIKNSK